MTVLGFGITLDQVKNYLGYPLSDDTNDFRVTMGFNAAVAAMGNVLGRNLVYGSYRDTFNPMYNKVWLTETPVAYLHKISNGVSATPASSYTFFPKTGLVEFISRWPFLHALDSCGDTFVDYVGGYRTLPADLQLALFTAMQALDVYQKQVAASGTSVVKRLTVYDVGVTEYATGTSSSSILSDTLSASLASYIVDGGYVIGTPDIHQSQLMGPAGFWDSGEASPPSSPLLNPVGGGSSPPVIGPSAFDTRPRFGLGSASAYSLPAMLLASMQAIPGSASDSHVGNFTLSTSVGQYGWVAVEGSRSETGVHFFDGVGYGGWGGAGLPGDNGGMSDDPSVSSITFIDEHGTMWRFFRQDFVNSNPSPTQFSLS